MKALEFEPLNDYPGRWMSACHRYTIDRGQDTILSTGVNIGETWYPTYWSDRTMATGLRFYQGPSVSSYKAAVDWCEWHLGTCKPPLRESIDNHLGVRD
jgi:hypothetical protein